MRYVQESGVMIAFNILLKDISKRVARTATGFIPRVLAKD